MIRKHLLSGLLFILLCSLDAPVAKAQNHPVYGACDNIVVTAREKEYSNGTVDHGEYLKVFELTTPRQLTITYLHEFYHSGTFDSDGRSSVTLSGPAGFWDVSYQPETGTTVIDAPAGTYILSTEARCYDNNDDPGYVLSLISVQSTKITPQKYTVTGGGTTCDGGTVSILIGLTGSDAGVTYQLYRDNIPVTTLYSSAGGPLSFGSFQTPGTYTVTSIAPCAVVTMNGSAVITDARPALFTAWNDGPKCTPTPTINLTATYIPGATYYWSGPYNFTQTTSGNTTSILGLEGTFTYSVYASINGCITSSDTTNVKVYSTPPSTSAGQPKTVCGLSIQLNANSAPVGFTGRWRQTVGPGITQFVNENAPDTWAMVTIPGIYKYEWHVTGAQQCSPAISEVTITYNVMPQLHTITINGSSNGTLQRCSNESPLTIRLDGSESGVSYYLKRNGSTISTIVSTGGVLTWPDQGTGTYTIEAAGTGNCTQSMSGNPAVLVNQAPALRTVSGMTVCTGMPVSVTLTNSESGTNYQLLHEGSPSGLEKGGTTGVDLIWPVQTSGNYTVRATRGTCTQLMSSAAVITINPVPDSSFTVSGDGVRCISSNATFTINLNGSQQGVSYQLKSGNSNIGNPVQGTGLSLEWSNLSAGGTYKVEATHGNGGCTAIMKGSGNITVNPLPQTQTLSTPVPICGTGFPITLGGSETTVKYQLKRGNTFIGTPLKGTGNPLVWSGQNSGGSYTVTATDTVTECTQVVGTVSATISPVPSSSYSLSGVKTRCDNDNGVTINMSGSQAVVTYQLKRDGVDAGLPRTGTGSPMSWTPIKDPGTYTVVATHTNGGCTSTITGPNNSNHTITIKPSPTIADAGPDMMGVCGLETTLPGNPVNTAVETGTWTQISESGESAFDDQNAFNAFVSASQPDVYTYQWTINRNGCISSDVIEITYSLAGPAADAGPDVVLCNELELPIYMSANDPSPGIGEWEQVSGPEGGGFSDIYYHNAEFYPPEPGTYLYRWRITNGTCPETSDTMRIDFGAEPVTVIVLQNGTEKQYTIAEAADPVWRLNHTCQWWYIDSNDVTHNVTPPSANWQTYQLLFPDFLSGNVTNASLIVEVSSAEGCFTRKVFGAEASQGGARIKQLTPVVQETSTEEDIQVYPVPASRLLHVEVPFEGSWKLALKSLNGVSAINKVSHERSTVLDVSETPAGLYFLYIQGSRGQVIRKVEIVK